MTTWHIKKTREDSYHVRGGMVDEEVNGSQFMGMLTSRHLSITQANDVLWSLGPKDIGYETGIAFKD